MKFRMHALEPASRANGPGLRAVVWFQGCTLHCARCFNPGTHDLDAGLEADTEAVVQNILAVRGIEGLSISGGEPFQQPEALEDLVRLVRQTPLSLLVFSGYPLKHIRAMPRGPAILARIDVLVAGPYIEAQHWGRGLLGSTNQQLHLLTNRYQLGDFQSIPAREVIIHVDGSVTLTGISPFPRETLTFNEPP
ncbi:MAG: radical SAM protein [Acidobacteria bacterium]|nr:radical SAM protein [Acidobacteriota bacterium]MBI3656835.1 radical SAM protein [Acidobacteriota bacterium]